MTVLDPTIIDRPLPVVERRWTAGQAALYALGVGAGQDPLAERAFTIEGPDQRVLPTFAALLSGGWPALDGGARLRGVAVGEAIEVLRPLLPVGAVRSQRRVSSIRETSAGALMTMAVTLTDAGNGEVLARLEKTLLVRGSAGAGGPAAPRAEPRWSAPSAPPDRAIAYPTRPEQALLYRLSGDRNPLHTDPDAARSAGFARPILHGLCTFGFTGRALLHGICDGDVARLAAMRCRYSRPVLPGQMLTVAIWRRPGGALFQTRAGGQVVVDCGELHLREPGAAVQDKRVLFP